MRNSFEFEELDEAVTLQVYTLSPKKWMLIDRETGQVYTGNEGGYWDRLDPVIKQKEED
jgi:hypothetical protein